MGKKLLLLVVFCLLSHASCLWAEQLSDSDSLIFRQYLESVSGISNFDLVVNQPITLSARTIKRADGSVLDIPATTLWATLVHPTGMERRPTVMLYCPYRRGVCANLFVPYVDYGYNVLLVDIRGTGSSEGKWQEMGLIEQYDMAYVVDTWIPSQPWSDGKVGMIGTSYMGAATLMDGLIQRYADGTPVHLKAAYSIMGYGDYYKDVVHGGNNQLILLLAVQGATAVLSFLPMQNDADDLNRIWNEHYEGFSYVMANWVLGSEAAVDGYFWDTRSTVAYWPIKPDQTKPDGGWGFPEGANVIPSKLGAMLLSGWYDIGTRGQLDAYQYGLSAHSPGSKAMIIGPWYHADGVLNYSTEIAARWFDWKIKGENDPFMVKYPVVLFVMGADRWRAEKSWPLGPSRVTDKRMYLSKKRPSIIAGDYFTLVNYTLDYSLTDAVSVADYTGTNPVLNHDPTALHGWKSRSPHRWLMGITTYINQVLKYYQGVSDSSMTWEDERDDELGVLTFTSAPLKADTEIVGPIALTFWAKTVFNKPLTQAAVGNVLTVLKSLDGFDENILIDNMNAKEVQWVVELNDVFTNGRAKNITSGWLAASHRQYDPKNPTKLDPAYTPFDPFYDHADKFPSPIVDDQIYPYVVELWPTDNVFKAGHRIRISISASDYPHLYPVLRPSRNTIVLDENHMARMDFKVANNNNEGTSWMWLTGSKNPSYTGTVPAKNLVDEYKSMEEYVLKHSDAASAQ